MSNLSLREIAQSQLDSTPVIDGQLIVCLDTGNAYRDTATAHVKIGSDLEVVNDLPLAPLAEKIYYLKPDKLYVFLGGNWTLLNDKTIDLDESIAKLPVGSSTVLNDDVEIITQDTDITQSHYYRRKLVVLWEYIKTKAQDFFAAKNHQHGKADITDFPTSMPASDVYPWAKAATKPSYTKAEIGLGKVDNTADADKTVKRATTAGTADSANSVAWGNVRDKPTTFPVEAHNHDDRYYTEAEVNSKLSGKVDNTKAGANGLINKLSTADGIPNDATVFISQHNDGKTASYYRRPISTLWTYIKSKADSVYQPKGSYAASNHSHDDRYYTEAEIDGRLNSKVDNNEAGANGLLSKLSVWTATPTDDTYFMRQDTDGTNQFGRVKFSTIWNYIRGKADSVYLKLSGGTVTGNTAITGSYLQVPMITGETSHDIRGTAQIKKAHGIQLGIPSRDYCNFYEYGGVWNFYKTKDSYVQESGDGVLIAKIDTNGVHANLIGTADNALKLGGLFPSTDGTSSTWGTIPTVATTGVTELGKYVDFHADNSGDVDYDIRLTANKGSLEVAGGPIIGSLLGNATTAGTANSLSGLSSRSSQGWGVQTGTFVHGECDSTGGDFAFRRDCPNAGQLSMVLDGRFYQNEGRYRVLDESDEKNLNVQSANFAKETYISQYKTVNLTDLDQNTWYPVTGTSVPYNGLRRFKCNVQLNSGSKPSWSTHGGGFTAVVDILYESSGWGITRMQGMVLVNDQIWINDSNKPPVGYQQMSNGSVPVWWLRGGGTYFLAADYDCTWTIRKSTYTNNGQSVSPTTTYPGVSVNRATITANLNGNAKTATNASNSSNSDKWAGLSWRHNHNTTDTWIPVVSDNAFDYILKHEISADKLPLTGGTISGALNFANYTWNRVGDDAYMGDHNIGGAICFIGANDITKVALCNKDNQGDYAYFGYAGGNILTNKKIEAHTTGHADQDLALSGGTMSGQITKSTGGSWIGDRDRAAIKSGYAGDWSYGAVAAMATKNGYWTIGNLGGEERLIFNYSTDSNYSAGKNETSQVYLPAQAGTIITSATIRDQTVNTATYSTYVKDIGNSSNTTFAYSKNGMSYGDYTWLAGWNGYELRAVHKSQFATAEQGVTASGKTGSGIYYVRFGNGTQMCWGFYKESDHSGSTSFPVAFNNSQYSLSLTVTVSSNNAPYITGRSTTGFSYARHGTSYNDVQWIAVGTWK